MRSLIAPTKNNSAFVLYVEAEAASIREDLVTLLECDSGITGKALADKMLGFIRNYLDLSNMCDQAYDRASNMSGKTNRAAVRMSSQYPLALYTHCTSHCLNLAVMASFEEVSIHNMIGATIHLLFCTLQASEEVGKSYKEHLARIEHVEAHRTLRTRWIKRIDALDHIKKLYSSIVAPFENISAGFSHVVSWPSDRCQYSLAGNNKNRILTNECLQYLRGLTTSLQEEAKDSSGSVWDQDFDIIPQASQRECWLLPQQEVWNSL